jgi:predicted dehydrogenase
MATAAGSLLASQRALGANDRIRVGVIGTGGRGAYLGGLLTQLPGIEIVAACDVYEPRRTAAAQRFGGNAEPVADYRRVLDRKDVDAVVIGAPDHWHVPMTIDAVDAGKDVYCEKPITHELSEGDKLIGAVERANRVVATGTQQRSWDHFLLAKEMVEAGRLGQITLAECYWYQNYLRRNPDDRQRVDASRLDWKAFTGPAREQPFDPERFLTWRFFWDFGGGIFTDLMTHWIDVIQWFMHSPSPQTVTACGATHRLKELECPDTVTAGITFPNYSAMYSGTMISSLEDGGIVFRGTDGVMKLTRAGFLIYRETAKRLDYTDLPEPEVQVRSTGDGTKTNLQNWLDCIRSRKTPNANVRAGVEAARTSHLANMAMRQKKFVS